MTKAEKLAAMNRDVDAYFALVKAEEALGIARRTAEKNVVGGVADAIRDAIHAQSRAIEGTT